MNKKELKIKDVIGYAPYGLCVAKGNKVINVIDITIDYPPYSGFAYIYKEDVYRYYLYGNSGDRGHKPVLRPLSDLYRTITHNGEEIIPIVECAKISFPNETWEFGLNAAIPTKTDQKIRCFYYKYGTFLRTGEVVGTQCQLFDYLNELKIDYRGLIDARLAINCNSLENNPYK